MPHQPAVVSWNVTAACTLRCPHCYLDAGHRLPAELTTSEGLRLIEEMAEAGTELLILTGGEPLLRPDLPVLTTRAAGLGIRVVLGTTGTMIDRERAVRLKAYGVQAAGISIDSVDRAKHDAFRGVAGTWRRAVAGIEACRAEGIEVLVHTTALRMNMADIPDIIRFAQEAGAVAFHLFFLVCTGRGERLTDLSPGEYEDLLSALVAAQERHPGMMLRARCAPYIARLAAERGLAEPQGAGCLAGVRYCRITPAGDVTACPYLPTPGGNVRERSFGDIWRASPELSQFRGPPSPIGGKCGRCPFNQGDSPACSGCRARAFAQTGNALAEDLWCLYQPDPRASSRPRPSAPLPWTEEALGRTERIPTFVRGRVKQAAEAHARKQGLPCVTVDVLDALRSQGGHHHRGSK